MIKNVKAIEANYEAHDLNISQDNKDRIWNEVDVRDAVVGFTEQTERLSLPFSLFSLVLFPK